jgi:hypothetical protein
MDRPIMNVGLHAFANVGFCAVVVIGLRVIVNVGPRAYVFYRFWEPPHAGEVLPKFSIDTNLLPFFAGEGPMGGTRRPRSSSSALWSYLHSVTSPLPR